MLGRFLVTRLSDSTLSEIRPNLAGGGREERSGDPFSVFPISVLTSFTRIGKFQVLQNHSTF